ncbi:MAG TPA: PP2C family protein-serine/threonine phosphatase [Kofleriaceae bacterium]|nr:PP2C family protein-serine/threonine phosphatase [Kofleriaceae bacterium]
MQSLWASASYEPHLLSLPFAFAPAAMSIVIAYAIVMRGATALRGWMLLHFASLLPYAIAMTLSPSLSSPAAAEAAFRLAAAFIPMAAAAGAGFQLWLLGADRRARLAAAVGVVLAAAWIVPAAVSDASVIGVRRIGDFWFADAGPLAWLELVTTFVISLPGFVALSFAAVRRPPSQERRQLRLVLAANLVTYSGLFDVALAYGIGVFPLGWLLSGIGSLLVVRALVVEDLLRARAFDTTAPRLVLHLAAGVVLGWYVLTMIGDNTWWGAAVALVAAFAGVRVTIAAIGLVNRGARSEGTLDRLLGQLVARSRGARGEPDVAQLAIEVIQLGVGVRVDVLLAAAEDWGWTTATGARVADELAPDPLLVGWLAEQRGAKFVDELAYVPDDVRGLLARVFEQHPVRAIVPVATRDDLLALVLVPDTARKLRAVGGAAAAPTRLRGRSFAFLERAAERFGEALVHVRLAKRAAERAALAREVELAAAVQQQLLPGKGPHVHGEVTVVGSWLPATRCAGDFWSVHALGHGRVLVVIGDVTGHGVASATVTAAASAACDVVVRRDGAELDLGRLALALDGAVRRVGGGDLAMTCFAAILDPEAREIRFVSCGHTTPYLCRISLTATGGVELQALVGRGNPLGAGSATAPKVSAKPLRAGDLVVWYTDGVIDAQDPGGEPFGDRRLQRMLRRLEQAHLAPIQVHATVHAAVSAHRAGRARHDDETLVVAQWRPPAAASTEVAGQKTGGLESSVTRGEVAGQKTGGLESSVTPGEPAKEAAR